MGPAVSESSLSSCRRLRRRIPIYLALRVRGRTSRKVAKTAATSAVCRCRQLCGLCGGAAAFVSRCRRSARGAAGAAAFVGRAAGAAAFVSPFLPDRYEEAQALTKVKLDGWNASQLHSGFITIDKTTDSNTYFVFAPALSKRTDAPVLLWLQGGPGASSLFGMFTEIGPFDIDEGMQVAPERTAGTGTTRPVPRQPAWHRLLVHRDCRHSNLAVVSAYWDI